MLRDQPASGKTADVCRRGGRSSLLNRGSFRKIADIGKLVSERFTKPMEIAPELQAQANEKSQDGKN